MIVLSLQDNKGLQVVWVPEIFPYVCHMGFASSFYEPPAYAVAYNLHKQIYPFMKDKITNGQLEFSIQPPLPFSATLDSKTGVITGTFVYNRKNVHV